ncbi:hypothetical protein Salat_0461600 [Sesamum alatum]|uniref:Uncharacterized protein n=1 Tax=Sesamum alatum TaxID=300844 RepID=A0AAE1Z3G4_9LAMI|nr:hypothetical protein Salat_0461600 [Sesamum alatum]
MSLLIFFLCTTILMKVSLFLAVQFYVVSRHHEPHKDNIKQQEEEIESGGEAEPLTKEPAEPIHNEVSNSDHKDQCSPNAKTTVCSALKPEIGEDGSVLVNVTD